MIKSSNTKTILYISELSEDCSEKLIKLIPQAKIVKKIS